MIDATRFMFDNEVERILLGTYKQERSALELSELYGIPIASCYRKIKELKNAGLISTAGSEIGKNGKIVKLYKANLQDAYVFYDNGRMKIRFTTILQMAKDFESRFKTAATSPIKE